MDRHNDAGTKRSIWPLVVTTTAVVAALVGVVLSLTLASDLPAVAAGQEARSGPLALTVQSSEWLAHDHSKHDHSDDDDHGDGVDPNEVPVGSLTDISQGFQMPGSMMPGTPDEGFQRLQANLTLVNRSNRPAEIGPDDFELVGPDGRWDALLGGTFVPMTVPAGNAFVTVVAFDAPADAIGPDLYVNWNHAGQITRLAIEDSEVHDHD